MTDQAEKDDASNAATNVGQLPHFAMRNEGAKLGSLRPPAKPFFKATSAEKSMSEKAALERPSGDRSFIERMGVMAPTSSYTPPPQRRTTEIPNLKTVRDALDAKSDEKKLTITKHIKVSGEISGCERLYVEGSVDATITGLKKIEIAPMGRVSGKADVDSAVVNGVFDGALTVRGHLEVAAGAVVTGTISYHTVSVASGGKLTGTVSQIDA
ncbi:MAG: polymer-forming cytoskeletal protein [Rhodospirillaceae bacterium]|nr:polymer-forming cytoskeletal protein [Rhodospirillaceae bacterium]